METLDEINKILSDAIADNAFPGATYAVVTKNKVYSNYLGKKELFPTSIDNAIDTIYDMASLTKVICTTTLMMQLIEKGKCRLYDNVNYYLPRFSFSTINIWHLMTHTSGLPEGISGKKDILSKDDVWQKIYDIKELHFVPGTHIEYSDINYILLGKIIEIICNDTLDHIAEEKLFKPLEMYDTSYLPKCKNRCAATEYRDDATMKGYVKGYVHDETAYALGGVAGHAGLFSTALDMSHFIQMILNDGVYNHKRILSKASINALFQVAVKEPSGLEQLPKARNLGWQTKDLGSSAGDLISSDTILHTGFTGTNVFIDRKNQIGFVLLTNRVHPTRANTKHLRVRACLGNYIIAHAEEFINGN